MPRTFGFRIQSNWLYESLEREDENADEKVVISIYCPAYKTNMDDMDKDYGSGIRFTSKT